MDGVFGMAMSGVSHLFMQAANQAGTAAAGETAALGIMGGAMLFLLLILVFYLIFLLVALVGFVLWILMIIDCARRDDFKGENDKLLWILILIFGGIIGAVIYYFVVKKKKN